MTHVKDTTKDLSFLFVSCKMKLTCLSKGELLFVACFRFLKVVARIWNF